MRGFFLLLLLTNVAFIGWQYLQSDNTEQIDPYHGISFDKKGLTLLSELPADKRPALREGSGSAEDETRARPESQEKPPNVTTPPVMTRVGTDDELQPVCYKASALNERATADKLIAGLKKLGASSLEQGSEQGQDTNYWVMLPPYNSRDKAAEAAARLSEKKLKDFFIVRSGDYENAISLGVFSTKERAKRRYDQVVALQARLRKPKIEAIQLPVKRYWVSWKWGGSAQLNSSNALLDSLGLEKAKEIACE